MRFVNPSISRILFHMNVSAHGVCYRDQIPPTAVLPEAVGVPPPQKKLGIFSSIFGYSKQSQPVAAPVRETPSSGMSPQTMMDPSAAGQTMMDLSAAGQTTNSVDGSAGNAPPTATSSIVSNEPKSTPQMSVSPPVDALPSDTSSADIFAGLNRPSDQAVVVEVAAAPPPADATAIKQQVVPPPSTSASTPVSSRIYSSQQAADAAVVTEEVKEMSILKRLHCMGVTEVSTFSDEFMEISAKQCQSSSTIKLLTGERNALNEEIKLISCKLVSNEEEQQRLAQIEEFEKADALSGEIDELRRKSKSIEDRISIIIDQLAIANGQMDLICNQRSVVLEQMLERFDELINQQEVEKCRLMRDKDGFQESENTRLVTEEERIALEKVHVDKEDQSLYEELKVIEDAISSQTLDISVTQRENDIKMKEITTEIKELEERLAQKREEEKLLLENINSLDARVKEVRRKYERQLTRIEDRQSTLSKSKSECDHESSTIKVERDRYFTHLHLQTVVIEHLDKWMKAVSLEMVVLVKVKNVLFDSKNMKHAAISSLEAEETDLVSTRKDCSTVNSSILKALSEKSCLQLTIEHLEVEERELNDKLPKLESEKKSHASARRFKEAGAVAKDIKDMSSRVEEIRVEVGNCLALIEAGTEAFGKLQRNYDDLLSKLQSTETEQELKKLSFFLDRAKCLNKVKTAICLEYPPIVFDGTLDDEDSINTSIHYLIRENSMRLLESELEGLVNEIAVIGGKYGIDTSLDEEIDKNEKFDEKEEKEEKNLPVVLCSDAINSAESANSTIDADDQIVLDNDSLNMKDNGCNSLEVESLESLTHRCDNVKAELSVYLGRIEDFNSKIQKAVEEEEYDLAAELEQELTNYKTDDGAKIPDLESLLCQLNLNIENLKNGRKE